MMIQIRAYTSALLAAVKHAGWLPLVVLTGHELCAHVLGTYRTWPTVDIPLHLVGGFAIAFFADRLITVASEMGLIHSPELIVRVLLVLTLTCTVAVFWEFAEWTADHTLGTQCQMGDLDDTLLDLLMGIIGAATFALAMAVDRINTKASNRSSEGIDATASHPQG